MAQQIVTLTHHKGQANLIWVTTLGASSKKCVIAACEPMNLAIEADSLDELYSLIPETIHLMLVDLLLDNELQPFLQEIGWQIDGSLPAKPAEDLRFEVPWQLVVPGGMGDRQRRAAQ